MLSPAILHLAMAIILAELARATHYKFTPTQMVRAAAIAGFTLCAVWSVIFVGMLIFRRATADAGRIQG